MPTTNNPLHIQMQNLAKKKKDEALVKQLAEALKTSEDMLASKVQALVFKLPEQVLKFYRKSDDDTGQWVKSFSTHGERQIRIYRKKEQPSLPSIESINVDAIIARVNMCKGATFRGLTTDFSTSKESYSDLHIAVQQLNAVILMRRQLGTLSSEEVTRAGRLHIPRTFNSMPETTKDRVETVAQEYTHSQNLLEKTPVGRRASMILLSILTLGGYAIGKAISSYKERGSARYWLSDRELQMKRMHETLKRTHESVTDKVILKKQRR